MAPSCCLTSCKSPISALNVDGFETEHSVEGFADLFARYSNNETMVLSEKYLPTIKKTFTGGVMPVSDGLKMVPVLFEGY